MRVGLVVVVCGLFGLAGCAGGVVGGMNEAGGSQAPGVAGARLTGAVHGGQNPVSGAHVYLFAAASGASGAGQAAYGGNGIAASVSNASVSLLTKGSGQDGSGNYYVATGSDGSFSISGDYTCAAGQQVYLYSVGGDPGLGTGVNPAAGLMAALGTCPSAGTFPSGMFVIVNEVSTVAAAYAMAGFATDATHVGSSGTALALTGIANAFANAANLETLGTGGALAVTPAGNGTVPQAEINTLANILAACVNSNGAVTGPTNPTACYTLFTKALAGGATGAIPADTATAAINIAHNPGVGTVALFGLGSGTPQFWPGVSAPPNDWTVAVNFSGGGLNGPYGVAVDGSGNVWATNNLNDSLSEFKSSGTAISGPSGYIGGGLSAAEGIAIDGSGNVWMTNNLNDSLSEFNSSGTAISGSNGYIASGLYFPVGIAIESAGNVWVANTENNGLSIFSSNGGSIMLTSGGGVAKAGYVAIDGSNNVWAANGSANSISKFGSSGTAISGASGYTGGGLDSAAGIAIDSSGSVWVANFYGNSISKFNSSGAAISGSSGYTGGGLGYPVCIAIDGSGNVWVANEGFGISKFNSSGAAISGAYGYIVSGGGSAVGIAIDGSGNVWASNGNNRITEWVGAATPVITPIVAGLPATPTADGSSNLGTRP